MTTVTSEYLDNDKHQANQQQQKYRQSRNQNKLYSMTLKKKEEILLKLLIQHNSNRDYKTTQNKLY